MRILVFIAAISVASSSTPLDIVYKWRTVEFDFPNEAARENHIRSKQYIPGTNVFPLDVDVWHGGIYI